MEVSHDDWQSRGADREGIGAASLAEGAASRIDWHEIAKLAQGGCPSLLACASCAEVVLL
jgi:hypothetical protein